MTTKRSELLDYAKKHGWAEDVYAWNELHLHRPDNRPTSVQVVFADMTFTRIAEAHGRRSGAGGFSVVQITGGMAAVKKFLREAR